MRRNLDCAVEVCFSFGSWHEWMSPGIKDKLQDLSNELNTIPVKYLYE